MKTDFINSVDNETITMKTEKNDIAFENTTFVSNKTNSTQFDTTDTEVFESTTSEVFESTMAEVFESSTTELLETTTQLDTTTVRSTSCVDSKFECCSDGQSPAKVTDDLLC